LDLFRAAQPPGAAQDLPQQLGYGGTPVVTYLRIMLDARLAKMDERGASAVEYGLLIAGIAALIVVVVFAFGGLLSKVFQNTCKSVARSTANSC
jgi:pilus assembly protein Flp/PilA